MGQTHRDPGRENGSDLTVIKGIGPVRQRWFNDSLNVYTYRELAALPAEEIESKLKAEGSITSRNDIEQWIAQAYDTGLGAMDADGFAYHGDARQSVIPRQARGFLPE